MLRQLFSDIIDSSKIIEADATASYADVTTGYHRQIAGVLKPETQDQISKIIAVCRAQNIKLYPISAGRNWGYSDAMPADHQHVILDMALMRGITDYDPASGVITIESGVTQGQLHEFLKAHGARHVVSVTGSSPEASIIGNYLERGFGLLPMMDHALSVLSLTAVLGDGTTYTSPLQAFGGHKSATAFRWGIGPYTDGLFFQSSFGIVTSMTIKLAPLAEAMGVCLVEIDDRASLLTAFKELKKLREAWPLESLQIKILNSYYSFASMGVKHDEIESMASINDACKKYDVAPYTVMITYAGHPSLTKVLSKYLKSAFKCGRRTRILTDNLVKIARTVKPILPKALQIKVGTLEGLWNLMQGIPSTMMIGRIPYYKMANDSQLPKLNPAQDKCGIIWFALILPFEGESLNYFEELGSYTQKTYGFAPILNFTNYTQSGMVGLFAIVFDQATESEKAQECYLNLLAKSQKDGYLTYRMPLFASEKFFKDAPDGYINQKLKAVLDPDNVFARQC